MASGLMVSALAQSPVEQEVVIGVRAPMQFDPPRIAVAPGARITLRFNNGDEMEHNLLITRPGQRLAVVEQALALGAQGPELNHVPATADVLWSIGVLRQGGSHTLRFTAPKEPGIYPYVCTFPGHGLLMYGAMYVGVPMPSLDDDTHVPPLSKTHGGKPPEKGMHAWSPRRRPLVYRIFMPDASPAAIAVALAGDVSYCFDAGRCRLRYAWHGGFVDPWPVWKGNGNGLAVIKGERFYSEGRFPFVLDGTPKFLGYAIVDRHPRFRYRIGDGEVREHVMALEGGRGIVRNFELEGLEQSVRFSPEPGAGTVIKTSPVPWQVGGITLTPAQAARFSVTIERPAKGGER